MPSTFVPAFKWGGDCFLHLCYKIYPYFFLYTPLSDAIERFPPNFSEVSIVICNVLV